MSHHPHTFVAACLKRGQHLELESQNVNLSSASHYFTEHDCFSLRFRGALHSSWHTVGTFKIHILDYRTGTLVRLKQDVAQSDEQQSCSAD